MSKVLIVPDVHGRTFWKYAKNHVDEFDKVVFLGDYLDPYPHEHISFDDAVQNFKQILDFKNKNKDKVVLLLGNHDMHYYNTGFMDCSRMNYARREEMYHLYTGWDFFNLAYIYDNYLFSHAGVYTEWLEENDLTLDDLIDDNAIERCMPALSDVSYWRGGCCDAGSCIWSDIRESSNRHPDTTYYQIVGHTQLADKPYRTPKIACLDVRKCFLLDTETKEITSIGYNSNSDENTSNK